MTDKMLRVAARNGEGLAKPLSVDENGALRVVSMSQNKALYGEAKLIDDNKTLILALEQSFIKTVNESREIGNAEYETGFRYHAGVDAAGNTYYANKTKIVKLSANGDVLWSFAIADLHVNARTVSAIEVNEQSIYVNTVDANAINGRLLKFDANGNIIFNVALSNATTFTGIIAMRANEQHVYAVTRASRLLKLDALTGAEVLSVAIDANVRNLFLTSTHVYLTSNSSVKSVLKINLDGTVLWEKALANLQAPTNIIVKNGHVFVHDLRTIYKINDANGDVVETLVDDDFVGARPRYKALRYMYLATSKNLIKVDLDTFTIVYKLAVTKTIDTLVEQDNSLFVYNTDGTIQCLSCDLVQQGITTNKQAVVNNNKSLNRGKIEVYETFNCYKVVAMLHDNYLAQKDDVYYVFYGGWDSEPQKIILPDGRLRWINFVEDKFGYWEKSRYRLVANIGEKLYHNLADANQIDVNAWAECNVWGLPNTLHPTDKTTKEYNGRVRPRYYVPPTATDAFNYMGGIQHYRVGTDFDANYSYQDSLWFATYSQTATPMSVFMTKNGKDVYCEYMYGINRATSRIGQDVDLSLITTTLPSGFKLRKITPIIPSVDNKEPEDVFAFGMEVAVTNISYADGKTTVNATSHGLATGDVIHFIYTNSQSNDFNWIKPPNYSSMTNNDVSTKWTNATTPPMGNGKIYQVKVIDVNTFTLHEAVGNPHNPLYCTHIHSLDVVPNGIVVSTGEQAELSNITFLSQRALSYLPPSQQRIFADYAQLHLTANPVADINGAVQRPLGFYMDEDYYLFASDEETYKRNVEMGEGRTPFGFRSSGIYKGKLSEIDDWSKAKAVLQPNGVAFMFKKIGDIFVTCDVQGDTYYSSDKGDTWHKLYLFDRSITKFAGANRDGKEFVIDGYYFVRE